MSVEHGDWHNFFGLLGGVATTLIGAMFGGGILTRERSAAPLWWPPANYQLSALALALLLAAAIRNSWDMIVFFVTRPKGPQ